VELPTDVLIYAVVAAGLVLWLRSILGTRHGDERERPNPYTPEGGRAHGENLSAISSRQSVSSSPEERIIQLRQQPTNRISISGKMAEEGLINISRIDNSFDIDHFLQGAQEAFIVIVEAFASGDIETLRNLLAEPVYNSFKDAIEQREKNGESVTTEIHAIRHMEITDALIKDRTAYITVHFTADETCVIRDYEGEIVSGNPERITEMADIWVFAREVKSRDPRWLLVETRDYIEEDHKTPLPEAGNTSLQ
jgi:predicted lipid-binding transport protein (Tim44 family)